MNISWTFLSSKLDSPVIKTLERHSLNVKKSTKLSFNQGNLLKGIDKKPVRREGIEPVKRVFTYVFFSVTHSKQNGMELNSKKYFLNGNHICQH